VTTRPAPAVRPAGARDVARRCPLCASGATRRYCADSRGEYLLCQVCALVFMHPADRLTPMAEILRYYEHENDGSDPRYVGFLRRLADPLRDRLAPGACGLDFGCGPVPALAELLTAQGFPTVAFDPLFRPDDALLQAQYDFVACSEVVEHLHQPGLVFQQLASLLRPDGVIGVMTRFRGTEAPFADWWYRRDPTHVCFFSEPTMRWIAQRHGWSVAFPAPNVTLMAVPPRRSLYPERRGTPRTRYAVRRAALPSRDEGVGGVHHRSIISTGSQCTSELSRQSMTAGSSASRHSALG
jgi:SAM-dependent methyltransferase